jgi:hypothetical protein
MSWSTPRGQEQCMNEIAYRQAEDQLFTSVGLTPTEQRIHLPQLDVDVRVQEVGDGVPVLFIHGGPNSGSTWLSLAARTHGLRCLLLDRPGTGLSAPLPDPVGPHNLAQYGSVLAVDVLDALGVDVAHLVVSSFGGYVGLQSAAAQPERFGRMVQMACPAFAPACVHRRSCAPSWPPDSGGSSARCHRTHGRHGRSCGRSDTRPASTPAGSMTTSSTGTWHCSGTPTR